jgi:hypothetical protein
MLPGQVQKTRRGRRRRSAGGGGGGGRTRKEALDSVQTTADERERCKIMLHIGGSFIVTAFQLYFPWIFLPETKKDLDRCVSLLPD